MKIFSFEVGGQLLGIEISHVAEVLRDQVVTPVPLAPACVLGLVNLRGEIVTAVDARSLLGLPPGDGATINVVVSSDGEAVSLLVDRAGEVLDLDDTMLTTIPSNTGEALRALTQDAYRVDGDLVLVLKGNSCTLC